jgi:hypothetical protein
MINTFLQLIFPTKLQTAAEAAFHGLTGRMVHKQIILKVIKFRTIFLIEEPTP